MTIVPQTTTIGSPGPSWSDEGATAERVGAREAAEEGIPFCEGVGRVG